MSDETPPGFDDNPDNIIALRQPGTGAPVPIPRDIALQESRPYKAYCDWLAGEKWEVIAERYEYPDARAAAFDITRYQESARALYNSFTVHQARALNVARLEALLQGLWKAAVGGNVAANNAAAARVNEIVKLMKLDQISDDEGDDAPKTIIIGGTEEEFIGGLEQGSG